MTCARGDHRAPRTGGSCPCGLVTFVPAPRKPSCPVCNPAPTTTGQEARS